jgi:hypothetical protein
LKVFKPLFLNVTDPKIFQTVIYVLSQKHGAKK